MKDIRMILARTSDWTIGRRNKLPWSYPEDLRFFKRMTGRHPVIMGRKTFESLPFKSGLPGRLNIVITTMFDEITEERNNVIYAPSVEAALSIVPEDGKAFVIGGATLYEQMAPLANTIYVTFISTTIEDGDTFFKPDLLKPFTLTASHEGETRALIPYIGSLCIKEAKAFFQTWERN